jgi:DNA polymerase III subunit gamma/tau
MAKKKTAPESPADAAPSAAEYTVLARRYRPQQFGDLVGQDPVAQALGNAIKTNRIAHAYLFTGARGVGKTSTARILAKCLNCVTGPTTTPCDECDMCRAITSGDDVDVIEIDGASNRGIEEIREIRSNVQYRPQRGRYKIYIIDEVHMLTTPAFNALLKTLEEPPPHVKFIFATTEASKIPITILSRCQRFDFAGIGTKQIVARLREIVASEKMQADDEALELIARRANTSMRDAQSLLDQLLAFGSDRLTLDRVHELLGTAHEDRVVALAAAILERDAKKGLGAVAEVVAQGQQLGELLDQLVDYWRDLMIVQAGGDTDSLSVTGQNRETVRKQAAALQPDTVLAGLDVLVTAKNRMRTTMHGRVVLEMAVVRLCRLDDLTPLGQLAQLVTSGAVAVGNGAPSTARTPASAPLPSVAPVSPAEKKKLNADEPSSAVSLTFSEGNLQTIWQQVQLQAGFVIASDLRRVQNVAISGPNTLVLRFPSRYNLRSDQLLEPTRQTAVEALLAKITGQACQVQVELVAAPENGDATHPVPASASPSLHRTRRLRAEVMEYPLVQKAVDVLGAQIVHVDEEFGKNVGRAATPSASEPDEESRNGAVIDDESGFTGNDESVNEEG